MNINWKLRLQNKATLVPLFVTIVTAIYQILAICGVTPSVTQSSIVDVFYLIVDALTMVGIVTDPTTKGVSDSSRAMTYGQPH